jgi:uncharacterized protein
MPGAAYMNPTAFGNFDGINYWSWLVVHLLGEMKFWSIFSMLFGAGIILMTERIEASGRRAAGIYYRRMLWLLVFGLLHAHLIWYGDILYAYAMCGLVLYFFRRLNPPMLVVLGLMSLLVAFLISLGFATLMASPQGAEMKAGIAASWSPSAEVLQQELDAYRGSWLEQLGERSPTALFFETFLFAINFGWRSAGLMLIGMALYKWNVFSATRSTRFYVGLTACGALIGLPLVGYGIYRNEQANWSMEYSFSYGPLFNYWGSVLVALAWVGGVMLICKLQIWQAFTRRLSCAGRMALSCYLLQSLVATAIFYGHGLGQFGHLERWQQYLVVIGIWIVCLVFSSQWLRAFRFGPFEWLWRSLTYWKLQPMLK